MTAMTTTATAMTATTKTMTAATRIEARNDRKGHDMKTGAAVAGLVGLVLAGTLIVSGGAAARDANGMMTEDEMLALIFGVPEVSAWADAVRANGNRVTLETEQSADPNCPDLGCLTCFRLFEEQPTHRVTYGLFCANPWTGDLLRWDYTAEALTQVFSDAAMPASGLEDNAVMPAASAASAEDCASTGATQYVDGLTVCASSVLPAQGQFDYRVRNLMAEGAWCEGQRGNGEGVRLTMSWSPRGLPWRTLYIDNGYQRTDKTFRDNGRIKDLRVRLDDGSALTVRLRDQTGEQTIRLPEWTESAVTEFTILSVYPGARYQDTCLTSLVVDMEEADRVQNPF